MNPKSYGFGFMYMCMEDTVYYQLEAKMENIYVGYKDSEFQTINAALNSLDKSDSPVKIYVSEGIYEERVNLKRNNVSLIGSKEGKTVITASEYAFRDHEDGLKVGTFRTATFMADCDNFYAENIVFENSAGQGSKVGQALALYADGVGQKYVNCTMLGYQDTIFAAPLPPKEYQKNGFLGEKQFMPRRDSELEFVNCRIEGNIDYIFGSATAIFNECTIFTRKREDEGICFVTAASTPEGKESGFIFNNCRFLSDAPKGTVYLGRPWREFAKTEFNDCFMDESVNETGYDDWNKPHEGLVYIERRSYGPGASDKRAEFVSVE